MCTLYLFAPLFSRAQLLKLHLFWDGGSICLYIGIGVCAHINVYLGNIQLNPSKCASIPSGVVCNNVQGKLVSVQFIGFLSKTYGLGILDPNFYALSDHKKS